MVSMLHRSWLLPARAIAERLVMQQGYVKLFQMFCEGGGSEDNNCCHRNLNRVR